MRKGERMEEVRAPGRGRHLFDSDFLMATWIAGPVQLPGTRILPQKSSFYLRTSPKRKCWKPEEPANEDWVEPKFLFLKTETYTSWSTGSAPPQCGPLPGSVESKATHQLLGTWEWGAPQTPRIHLVHPQLEGSLLLCFLLSHICLLLFVSFSG
jgi:hypothetical protein